MDVKILILLNKQDYSFALLRQWKKKEGIQLSYQMEEEYKRCYLRNTIISSHSHPHPHIFRCFNTQKFQFL